MTKDEAIKVMTDVALHRKPHSRAAVKIATAVLEPPAGSGPIDPKDELHRINAAKAARVQAEAKAARADANADAAIAAAKEANEILNAVDAPAPAPVAVSSEDG